MDTEAPRHAVSGFVSYFVQPFPGPPKLFDGLLDKGMGKTHPGSEQGEVACIQKMREHHCSVNAETGKVCFALFRFVLFEGGAISLQNAIAIKFTIPLLNNLRKT